MSARTIKGLTILFFVMVIGTVAIGLLYVRTQKNDTANTIFQSLISNAEQLVQTYQTKDLGLRALSSNQIFAKLNRSPGVLLTVINGSQGETILVWKARIFDIKSNSVSNSIPIYEVPKTSLQNVVFETSLPGAMHLIMVFSVLATEDIFFVAYCLLAAMGIWVLFLLLMLWMGAKKVESENGSKKSWDATNTISTDPVDADSSEKSEISDSREQSEKSESDSLIDERPRQEERDSKFILLDRKTGVTQERFLKFRLDKELERNAENALDLSLAIFRFNGLSVKDYATAAGLLLSEFSHEDLIFEYGTDTFCVILPQHDLDQAIVRSELVMKKAESLKETDFELPFEITVGLTSRNGRLLDASRFMKEVQVALRKASREEGRIVGFRPDPVRFRNFLRHQRV